MTKKTFILILTLFLTNTSYGLQYQPTQTDVIITVAAVLVTSAAGAGVSSTTFKSTLEEMQNKDNTQQVILYMQTNHDMLVRDIAIGRGPLIEQWGNELHLTGQELRELEKRLSGSGEQLLLLKALNGTIGPDKAHLFKKSLQQLFTDIIGAQRLKKVIRETLNP